MGTNNNYIKPIAVLGVEGLVLFPVLSDTKTELTTDDANLIDLSDCMVSKAYSPQLSEGEFWSSNKKASAIKSNKGGNVTYVIPSLPTKVKEALLGATKNASGMTVQSSNDVSPEFIAAHKVKLDQNNWRLEKFAKVVFGTPSESAETEKDSVTYQTAELVGTVVPLNYEAGGKSGFLFTCDSDDTQYAELEALWGTKGTAGIVAEITP